MNLRTRYKRLKQYVESAKVAPDRIFIDRSQLEHYRYKSNIPLLYGRSDPATDERAMRIAKYKLKDEFLKMLDPYIEILPDGTMTLDIWLKPESSLVKDGVTILEEDKNDRS